MALRLGVLALAAALFVAVAVGVAGPRDDDGQRAAAGERTAATALRGIPQDGAALGDADAPVTMVEFADLQCPFCAAYHAQAFPQLLEYVRSGKLRLELRLLRFLGPDSDRLARVAAGAAAEDRMWQVAGLAYARQGHENSGHADDAFLDGLVADAGLKSVDAGPRADAFIARAERLAHHAGIDSTPSFLIGPTGGRLSRFQPGSFDPAEFAARIEQELRP